MRRPRDEKTAIRNSPSWRRSRTDRLPPERRIALEARVAGSAELADRLAEQQRAVALARAAATEVEAPPALRARIDAKRGARRAPGTRRFVVIGAVAAAAVAAVVGLGIFRSGSSSQRFQAALAATELAPGAAATQRSPRHPQAGGSSSTRAGYHASTRGASTKRGCGTGPACWCRLAPSTRATTSRSGLECHRRPSRR